VSSVFILDDDPLILRYLAVCLGRNGYECLGFETSAALYERLEARTPDLAIVDLFMPDANGLEILRELKRRRPDLPVIVSTASDSQDDVIEALRASADDFVKKPLRDELILSAVKRTIERVRIKKQNEELLERLKETNRMLEVYRAEMERELLVAQKVQDWLMRIEFPAMNRFRFHHKRVPSIQVGGDFIDIIQWRESERRGIVFVDIAGHGVSAALIAPIFRGMVRDVVKADIRPAAVMRKLFESGRAFFDGGRFASVLYVLLDDNKGTATIAKGGQEPAVIIKQDSTGPRMVDPMGFPIGMDLGDSASLDEFEEITVHLEPRDRLILYTDGLVEAAPEARPNDIFGRERLHDFFHETRLLPSETFADMVFNEALAHCGRDRFRDDCTLAIVDAV
jgi:serine phosphatase RsbU (regulator of sigma subunit)